MSKTLREQLTACNRLAEMIGVCPEGVEITRPTATAQLKMKDTCILSNVIENFWRTKVTLWPFWEMFLL
jgi:hypothetical protein